MSLRKIMPWAAAVLSAALLELPFPLAGPLPAWRGIFAWVGLVPLLWAVLAEEKRTSGAEAPAHYPFRHAFLIGYLCGVLWYAGNCYWIYDTMHIHGGVPAAGSAGILLLFSLVLGAYFGIFALGLKAVQRWKGLGWALIAAPFFWTALDLAAARITSVPWDQLGYSQVDSSWSAFLAPWTGVYGIAFILVAWNALLTAFLTDRDKTRSRLGYLVALLPLAGIVLNPSKESLPAESLSATAVLMQPNLDVGDVNNWPGPLWGQHIAEFQRFATENCGSSLNGIPETGAVQAGQSCGQPSLVAWPESPAPYYESENQFRDAMKQVALAAHSPLVIGGVGIEQAGEETHYFNSGMVFDAQGNRVGRYDKIHLVPYGEFIPYRDLFFFAKKLTRKVDDLTRGASRNVFRLEDAQGKAHRYGVFICYESVFADEIREFAKNGAEVFVNISDDGWYGDTSAPWQHLNMARMRAIENRRWILRDTNNGVTAAIDPYGRVRQSIPRHTVGALVARYGFNSETTFYTEHGDVFAWVCAILSIGVVVWSWNTRQRQNAMSGRG